MDRSRAEAEVVSRYFDLLEKTQTDNRQIYKTFLPLNESKEILSRMPKQSTLSRWAQQSTSQCCVLQEVLSPRWYYTRKPIQEASTGFFVCQEWLWVSWFGAFFSVDEEVEVVCKVCCSWKTNPPSGWWSCVPPDVINFARENQIILLCLPPHTTHALQPLDVSARSLEEFYGFETWFCACREGNGIFDHHPQKWV